MTINQNLEKLLKLPSECWSYKLYSPVSLDDECELVLYFQELETTVTRKFKIKFELVEVVPE